MSESRGKGVEFLFLWETGLPLPEIHTLGKSPVWNDLITGESEDRYHIEQLKNAIFNVMVLMIYYTSCNILQMMS